MVQYEQLIQHIIIELEAQGNLEETRGFIQHGNISVYEHCLSVAVMSCKIALFLHLPVDYETLIKGALLHDYFLYDWHDKDNGVSLHGFYHPGIAAKNAARDYELSDDVREVILRHMFPLTIIPPKNVEGWVVCLADKICASSETIGRFVAN